MASLESIPPELLHTALGFLDETDIPVAAQYDGVAEEPKEFAENYDNDDAVALAGYWKHGEDSKHLTRLRAFHSLCLASRALRAAATPYLYKHFRSSTDGSRTHLLARTLCQNQELVRHVHSVALAPSASKFPASPPSNEVSPSSDVLRHLEGNDVCERLRTAIHAGCYKASAIVLLILVTNIRRLHISMSPYVGELDEDDGLIACARCPAWESCLQAVAQLPNHFQRLGKVTIIGESAMWRRSGDSYNILSAFLTLPVLQSLHGIGLGSHTSSLTWLQAPVPATITTLSLRRGFLSTNDVVTLLASCKALRNLSISWDADLEDLHEYSNSSELFHPVPTVDQGILFAALRGHAPTLETFIVENLAENLAENGQIWIDSNVDLSEFTALRELEVDSAILHGEDAWTDAPLRLPPALAKLTIHMFVDTEVECLGTVLAALSRYQCETLETVQLTFPQYEGLNENWPYCTGSSPWDPYADRPFDRTFKSGVDDDYTMGRLLVWIKACPAYHACGLLAEDIAKDGVRLGFYGPGFEPHVLEDGRVTYW